MIGVYSLKQQQTMKIPKSIITHPGQAHRDDFMSAALVLTLNPSATVYRKQPTAKDLADPEVWVLDTGRDWNHERNNYDHHQLVPNIEDFCTLSLVLMTMGKYYSATQAW